MSIFSSICCLRRDYFITAEEHWWDYAPSKQNLITNDRTISDRLIQTTEYRIGSVYKKVKLKQFTDGSFRREIEPAPWMGYVGPTIKGETGDVLYVHFRNLASRPYGLHPHGVQYFKDSEGSLYMDGTSGRDKLDDTVPPGYTYTYRWSMLNTFAPTKDDENCVPVGYHPHVRSTKDIDTGVVGILLICKPGTLNPDNSRKDVDREFVLYADTVNETNSWLIDQSLNLCLNPQRCRQLFNQKNEAFITDTLMYSINGYIYGNLPDFPVYEGEKVAFYAMGLNLGLHVFGVQGQSFTFKRKRAESVCLTIDLWSSRQMRGFLGITGHFILDWAMKSVMICCKRFKGRHTAESIRSEYEEVVTSFEIGFKIAAIVSDNASNMVKAFSIPGFDDFKVDHESSAPVERLFSTAGKTFRPERCRLADGTFEKLMMVKCNGKMLK
ncbi:Hypothetical predicted protein [Mytilus galloprovincialis]|nr:Hypothetical predicted protein [Mytilus galloprovincialis]